MGSCYCDWWGALCIKMVRYIKAEYLMYVHIQCMHTMIHLILYGSRDFWPSYGWFHELRALTPKGTSLLVCTATVTHDIHKEVIESLEMTDCETVTMHLSNLVVVVDCTPFTVCWVESIVVSTILIHKGSIMNNMYWMMLAVKNGSKAITEYLEQQDSENLLTIMTFSLVYYTHIHSMFQRVICVCMCVSWYVN